MWFSVGSVEEIQPYIVYRQAGSCPVSSADITSSLPATTAPLEEFELLIAYLLLATQQMQIEDGVKANHAEIYPGRL